MAVSEGFRGWVADIARQIVSHLSGMTDNTRDAMRVARLAPRLGVEKAIKLLLD